MASVEQINIKNFKSHSSFHSNIEGSQVAVFGNNGIGKTNLLESLSFFSNSKGMRGNKLGACVQIGYFRDEFVHLFVKTPVKQSPLINRGKIV